MTPSLEAAALAAEQRAGLLDALNRLRLEDRQVIAYRYFSELTAHGSLIFTEVSQNEW